jgi:putative ATP-dependent endonuclease of OLD family
VPKAIKGGKVVSPGTAEPEAPAIPEKRPRLHKLTISNFRCIGSAPVEILLDDIVVLVGPNNVGKSSILRAYEIAMSEGSSDANLTIDDFPFSKIDEQNPPTIELETVVFDNAPGEKWIRKDENGKMFVREQWTWNAPGGPTRRGYEVATGNWHNEVPWGAANVANSRRPQPHRVEAFADPTAQANKIVEILKTIITERIASFKAEKTEDAEKTAYQLLLEQVAAIHKKVVIESKTEVAQIEEDLSRFIREVFPNYRVTFDARPEQNLDKCVLFFKQDSKLLMGPADGYQSPIDRQGSGARRTLLWTALRLISETAPKKKSIKSEAQTSQRPHVLLLDEPETCLHPSAIRDACRVLYDLPKTNNWQVMVTTHCPAFVDVSRDNTTIVRVDFGAMGQVQATTVFRPQKVQLSNNDREKLKLLNIYDPYVAEFFFGGRNIVVEGDTEYTAFKHVIATEPVIFKGIHIIRARGKATIVSLVKILNHFGSSYSVLHDSDRPLLSNGNRNSAWTVNQGILEAINTRPQGVLVRLMASKIDFESAIFGKEASEEKPYNAIESMKSSDERYLRVKNVLTALLDHTFPAPEYVLEWSNLELLAKAIDAK